MTEDLTCLDAGRGDCSGPVELRTTPDRSDFKHFPRCEAHFERAWPRPSASLELTSPSRPAWYDEATIGERWDEDE
jgi:hypothetical protein